MPRKAKADESVLVLFEEIRSQNRATIEAVEASRLAGELNFGRLEQELRSRLLDVETALRRIDSESRGRDSSLELAVRDIKVSVQQNSVDIRELSGRLEALTRLEARVAALERRGA